jgi:hypothetical protein
MQVCTATGPACCTALPFVFADLLITSSDDFPGQMERIRRPMFRQNQMLRCLVSLVPSLSLPFQASFQRNREAFALPQGSQAAETTERSARCAALSARLKFERNQRMHLQAARLQEAIKCIRMISPHRERSMRLAQRLTECMAIETRGERLMRG